jgi:integrase/recombinase XerD
MDQISHTQTIGYSLTYEAMMVRFVEEYLPGLKPRSAQRYLTSLRVLDPVFRALHLDEINRSSVADYIASRKKQRVTDATIRRDLACLSSALTCAVEWDMVEHNILKSLPKKNLKESKPRTRWLTRDEYASTLECATDWAHPIIIMLAETGMRLGELLSVNWRNIDLERNEIFLPDTKSGRPRVVPLSAAASAQISAQPRHLKTNLLFYTSTGRPLRIDSTSTAIKRAMVKAKVQDASAHDLRHTFASWYLQNGGRLERLQLILGHARIDQTTKYAHLSTADLHEDLAKVGTNMGTRPTD